MIYSYKIMDGNDDGYFNTISGTSINSSNLPVGNWYFINSISAFRFKIPIDYGAQINSAFLTLFLEETEGEIKNNHKIKIYISNELNAAPLSYGINRDYNILHKIEYDNVKLQENNWNSFEITPIIDYIVNRPGWNNNNYIVLKLEIDCKNEIFKFGSADIIPTNSAILTIEYNSDKFELSDKINFRINNYIVKKSIDKDIILDDIEMHPEGVSFTYNTEEKAYSLGIDQPVSINLEERTDFDIGYWFLNRVGFIMPFKFFNDCYNVILQNIDLNYSINYVDINMDLIII